MNHAPITQGSGNVFADLGFPDPQAWEGKARLAAEIMAVIARRQWTQKEAAAYLGVTQTEISNIKRGPVRALHVRPPVAVFAEAGA